jgi:hypothetical protein
MTIGKVKTKIPLAGDRVKYEVHTGINESVIKRGTVVSVRQSLPNCYWYKIDTWEREVPGDRVKFDE